ncbi:MAG: hypothetical protein CMM60_14130 [Rhodospirillaceae bacterium]|nr:hypothetical protein [Rhodospirillaceae bacterium]
MVGAHLTKIKVGNLEPFIFLRACPYDRHGDKRKKYLGLRPQWDSKAPPWQQITEKRNGCAACRGRFRFQDSGAREWGDGASNLKGWQI